MTNKQRTVNLSELGLHIAAVAVVLIVWLPIASWYWNRQVLLGVDFFNSVSYVRFIHDNWQLRSNGWKDSQFSGFPLSSDYPGLHYYLISPLVSEFGVVRATQVYMLGAVGTLLVGAYLLFWQLSQSRSIAAIVSLGVGWSVGLYGALVWGGSLPFFASQSFYPWCLFFLVRYLGGGRKLWLWAAALLAGVSMFGHPLVFSIYVVPAAAILILFWPSRDGTGLSAKIRDLFRFLAASLVIGFVEVWYMFGSVVSLMFERLPLALNLLAKNPIRDSKIASELATSATGEITEQVFARNQLASIVTQTNAIIFGLMAVGAAVWIVSVLVRRKKSRSFEVIPVLILAIELTGYIAMYAFGIPFFHGGWYRTFWAVPIVFGMVAAALWGNAWEGFWSRVVYQSKKTKAFRYLIAGLSGVIVLFVSYAAWPMYTSGVIDQIETRSTSSSAFPDSINLAREKTELAALGGSLKPAWINGDDFQYRLYSNDATVNIWWNTFFNLPLVRGYIDPPLNTAQRWGLFWIDAVMGTGKESDRSSLEIDWKIPSEIVKNNAAYLLDWYAVKYMEGNHLNQGNSGLAKNVIDPEVVERVQKITTQGSIKKYGAASGKEEWNPNGQQSLVYYKVKDELISPVLSISNARSVLLVGSDAAYDSLIRFLGMRNLNSRKFIIAKGPRYIDDVQPGELHKFDGLVLYGYDWKNYGKAWGLIEKYVKSGGRVLVETGIENKESSTISLPANFIHDLPWFFPIKRTTRTDLGTEWDAQVAERFAAGVNVNTFSPLLYNGQPWNISHPAGISDLTAGSEAILTQQGIPVMAINEKWGGVVVWSGLNFPYHIIRDYNPYEAALWENILDVISAKSDKGPTDVEFTAQRKSANEYTITGQGNGVVFKQQLFTGWKTRVDGRAAKIYPAGPSYPGFMYVPLEKTQAHRVEFKYAGSPLVGLFYLVSGGVVLLILDLMLIDGRITSRAYQVQKKLTKPLRDWWNKDHE